MEIKINKDDFVRSNMLDLSTDVECIFSIDANRGIDGQLLKLSKSNELKGTEGLEILLGRLTCIGEEWNYNDFNAKDWEDMFEPADKKVINVLKEFEVVNTELFIKEVSQFQKYFREKKFQSFGATEEFEAKYSGPFQFDNKNFRKYHKQIEVVNEILEVNFGFPAKTPITSVMVNRKSWNWKQWSAETEDSYILFEEFFL